jgi:hypothetical protein
MIAVIIYLMMVRVMRVLISHRVMIMMAVPDLYFAR